MEKESKKPNKVDPQLLKQIEEQMVQFGSVTAVIHDGRVVQLDTSNKIRLI